MKHITAAFENIFFYTAFFISRIPIWFVLVSCLYNSSISPSTALYGILAILIARSYTEAELVRGGVVFLTFMQVLRIFAQIGALLLIYIAFLYFNLLAAPVDQILIAAALIICVIVFMETKAARKIGAFSIYFRGYHLTFLGALVTSLFWLYLAFIPDTYVGNCLMIVGIYAIELFTLFQKYNLPEYA